MGCGAAIINEVNFTTRSVLEEYEGAAGKLEETKLRQQELLKVSLHLDRTLTDHNCFHHSTISTIANC